MGCMSASDAAPLPRLGEVFFDVRGSSRSMRLSWYSDTGVAVFSIWQGGTCTGTFRLPIDDLPRMVDALQRGPRGAAPPAGEPRDPTAQHRAFPGTPADPAMPEVANFPDYATGQFGGFPADEFPAPEPAGTPAGFQGEPYRDRGQGAPEGPFQSGYAEPPPPAYPDSAPPYGDDPLGQGGYQQDRASRYRDEPPSPYGDDPLGLGSYPDDARPSYRDEPYRNRGQGAPEGPFQSGYAEPPPPAYPDSAPPYGGDPLGQGGYQQDRASRYRDEPPSPYGDDPLGLGSYRDDARPSYRDEPYQPSYRDEPPSAYPDEPPSAYPDEPQGHRYADDPFQSVYPDDSPGPGYTNDPPPGSFPYGPPPDSEMREHRAPRGRS
jgi:hypothetical protein